MRKGSKHSIEARRKLSVFRIGKKATEETKIKMRKSISEALRGRKFTPEWKKKLSESAKIRKRHSLSEGHRRKISEAHKGMRITSKQREKLSGKNHHNWQGGKTPISRKIRNSLEYKLWRKAVLEKDNYTCQKCEQYGGQLTGHHINNFAEREYLRFALDNGIILCETCHGHFHKKYGKHNNTKEQLNEFLYGN